MSEQQDDKTTTKYLAYTFLGFVVLGILLIVLANTLV